MGGSGPPPDPNSVRGMRGRVGPLQLPKEGRKGAPPRWPLAEPMDEDEKKAWRDLWKKPQAVAWERTQSVRAIARFCRLLVASERKGAKPQLLAEVRQIEDRLGLTPKAMKMLMWEIVDDEVAQQRQTSTAGDARKRIKAVG